MSTPFSSAEMQELAAGYVLGDLSSAEAERFKQILTDLPTLELEVLALKEALAMLPYGLEEAKPEAGLRSQILTAAKAEFLSASLVPQAPKRFRLRLPWVVSAMTAGLAIICGLSVLRLSGQVRSLQANYRQTQSTVSLDHAGIHQTWSGLRQLLNDHQQSLADPTGPVDFVVSQPDEIPSMLKEFQATVATLPLLPAKQGMLLGGSNCQFGDTRGLRLTYQLGADKTVSAYQLDVSHEHFPEFQAAQLTVQQPDGTGIVLWRSNGYLYALVADLPTTELQSLVYAIDRT